jgi:hypothetical protein
MRPRLILRPRKRYLNPLPFTRERRGYPPPPQQEQRKESNVPEIDPIKICRPTTPEIELDNSQNPWESKMSSRKKRETFFWTTIILMCIYTLLTMKILRDTDVPEIAEALFLLLAISLLCRNRFWSFISGAIVTLCFQLVWAITSFSFGTLGLS